MGLTWVLVIGALQAGCEDEPPGAGDAATDTVAEDTAEPPGETGPPGDSTSDDTGADTAAADAVDGTDADECDGRTCDECVACKFKEASAPSCGDEDPPERCEAEPTSFAWDPASALTHIEIASSEAKDCCFNIDGSKDGSADNQLGEVADALPFDVDREMKERLVTGAFATLMEHQGLESLEGTQSFDGNVFVGYFADDQSSEFLRNAESDCDLATEDCAVETSSGESFRVSPESFDDGTHPQVQFHPAELEDGRVTGGPSRLVLNFGVRGIGSLVLRIHGATIEAEIDREASDLAGDGVVVTNGKLGGYVLLKDVVALLNNLLTPCGCLGNPEVAIRYPGTSEGDPDLFPDNCSGDCALTCTEMVRNQADDCGPNSGLICRQTDQICSTVGGLVQLADLDSDNDGQLDALSIGALFEMTGARIAGVADYIAVRDQLVRGGAGLLVERAFANESGWIAIYTDSSLSPDSVVGHREIAPGDHSDLSVDVPDLEENTGIRAVLHRDDGPQSGTFKPEEDSKVKRYPEMSGHVADSADVRVP